jgi:hypothetical protein
MGEGGRFQQNSRETRGEIAKSCLAVIASEAKQSSFGAAMKMDCFVACAPRNDGLKPGCLKSESGTGNPASTRR